MGSHRHDDLPDVQVLNAAVIRLMSNCAQRGETDQIRTLVALLRELRDHPDLSRQPAVLASLAEAHWLWVECLARCEQTQAFDTGEREGVARRDVH
jgi:hypothetical protein